MKKRAATGATDRDRSKAAAYPTVEECKRMGRVMRPNLERIEERVLGTHNRIAAEVDRRGMDVARFNKASATIVVSVAAALMDVIAERADKPADGKSFVDAARDAAEFVRRRAARSAKNPRPLRRKMP